VTDRTIDFRYRPARGWTAICRPDDPYKTLVSETGALLYDLVADRGVWCFTRVIEFALRTSGVPIEVTQRTEHARTPVVQTTARYSFASLELTTFAHIDSDGRRADIVIWEISVPERAPELLAQLLVTASERQRTFTGPSEAPAHDIAAVDIRDVPVISLRAQIFSQHDDSGASDLPPLELSGPIAFRSVSLPLEPASSLGVGPLPALATEGTVVLPGTSLRGAILVPLNGELTEEMDLAWAEAALEAERRFWEDCELLRLPIDLPDPELMDMVVASARNILQAREIVDGLPEFRVGSAVFRGLWVVDGHFMLEAAQYLGHAEEARAGLQVLLRRSQASGAITEMPFHTKETAIALTTIVRQCELLGDDEGLRHLWPRILAGLDYIEALRTAAYALPPDDPAHGLLPHSFPDGGIGGLRPEYTSTFWTLTGLKTIGAAAHRLGLATDAARVDRMFAELMRDFRDHAARDRTATADGTPYLPMAKPGFGEHTWVAPFEGEPPVWRRIYPQTGTWALAQAIYPGAVFGPEDEVTRDLLGLFEAVDDEQGIPPNTAFWTYRMIWTYSASFYAHAWLYAGRPGKAVDYLYSFANHAFPTRVWREEQPMIGANTLLYSGDMPHNWASAEFVRLVRHLLVLERGDELDLLPGLPAEWLAPGMTTRLEATPTHFGPISVRVDSHDGEIVVRASGDSSRHRRPERVLVHVPTGHRVASATVGSEVMDVSHWAGGVLELPGLDREAEIRLGSAEA
jgi:hypothetical protein